MLEEKEEAKRAALKNRKESCKCVDVERRDGIGLTAQQTGSFTRSSFNRTEEAALRPVYDN